MLECSQARIRVKEKMAKVVWWFDELIPLPVCILVSLGELLVCIFVSLGELLVCILVI